MNNQIDCVLFDLVTIGAPTSPVRRRRAGEYE